MSASPADEGAGSQTAAPISGGKETVEWNERLAGPESRESFRGHHVATGGGIIYFYGVGVRASCGNDEVGLIDPDQRRERQVREVGWIPSNGKNTQTVVFRGGGEICERRAARANFSEPSQRFAGWH